MMDQAWKTQMRGQIRTLAQLEAVIDLTDDEREAIQFLASRFRMGIRWISDPSCHLAEPRISGGG